MDNHSLTPRRIEGHTPRLHRRRSWLLRRDRKNVRRRKRISRRRVDYGRQLTKVLINEHTKESTSTDGRTIVIKLPERLDFEQHYSATVSHFFNVRLAARGKIRLKSLDFSNLRYISSSAALVLASEVDRWNQHVKRKLRAKVETWHEDIRRLLCQMGYFELLGLPNPNYPALKPTIFLPFVRGIITPDSDPGKLAKALRQKIEQTIGAKVKKMPLFDGLSEAITNVSHHAYTDEASFRQWWLSGSFDQSDQRLCVTFYDQGLGIPATLPYSKIITLIANFLNLRLDSEKIEAAMEVGRTATGMPNRGKGLQNLLEFAKAYDWGNLTIYSLHGMYRVNTRKVGNRTIQTVDRVDHEHSIGGTLIEWSVQLPLPT